MRGTHLPCTVSLVGGSACSLALRQSVAVLSSVIGRKLSPLVTSRHSREGESMPGRLSDDDLLNARHGQQPSASISLPVLLLFIGAGLCACTTLEPWQRGTLAQPAMALDPHPLQSAARNHDRLSREAAAGGGTRSGGGCGCY